MNKYELARRIAEESFVLLRNEGDLLPLKKEQQVAFFGRTQLDTIFSGNGSGATATKDRRSILYACEAAGLQPVPALKAWYEAQFAEEVTHPRPGIDWSNAWELVHSGVMYEVFGKYIPPQPEYQPDESLLDAARTCTDTAVIVLGRNAGGEECDRHLAGDYLLRDEELVLYSRICARFEKVVLIVNSNGPVDLSWTQALPAVRSILFAGIPGEKGAEALANVLTGQVTPSGKLAMTFARWYEDYPSAVHFSFEKDDRAKLRTYASYGLKTPDDELSVSLDVTNTGCIAGKEIVQIYVRPDGIEMPRPVRELKGFAKVELAPGETKTVTITLSRRAFAYWEERIHEWFVEPGPYIIEAGASSRDIRLTAAISCLGRPLTVEITPDSTMGDLLRLPGGEQIVQQMTAGMAAYLGADSTEGTATEAISQEMVFAMIRDMPLHAMSAYAGDSFPKEAMDGMIAMLNNQQQ